MTCNIPATSFEKKNMIGCQFVYFGVSVFLVLTLTVCNTQINARRYIVRFGLHKNTEIINTGWSFFCVFFRGGGKWKMLAQALINPDKHGFHYSDELIKTVGRDWIKKLPHLHTTGYWDKWRIAAAHDWIKHGAPLELCLLFRKWDTNLKWRSSDVQGGGNGPKVLVQHSCGVTYGIV